MPPETPNKIRTIVRMTLEERLELIKKFQDEKEEKEWNEREPSSENCSSDIELELKLVEVPF